MTENKKLVSRLIDWAEGNDALADLFAPIVLKNSVLGPER